MERILAAAFGNGQLGTIKQEIPELKEHEVLIKVHASLISPGTEMNLAKNFRKNPNPNAVPIPFGYSNAGEIIAVKGDVKDLKVGMRVAAMGGGAKHTNYACVPVNLVVPIPDSVSYEQATFLSLAATSLQAVRRTDVQLGEYGVVLGMGIVGNLAAQLYSLSGARVLGWEGFPLRKEIAAACGINAIDFKTDNVVEKSKAFAAPYGLDYALFAFGGDAEKSFMDIKDCMKVSADGHQMGRIVLVGGCRVPVDGGAASGNLDIRVSSRTGCGYHDTDWEYGKDYPAAFVQFTTQRNARELIQLMSEKRLLVDPMITHKIKLQNAEEAGHLLLDNTAEALGVIFEM